MQTVKQRLATSSAPLDIDTDFLIAHASQALFQATNFIASFQSMGRQCQLDSAEDTAALKMMALRHGACYNRNLPQQETETPRQEGGAQVTRILIRSGANRHRQVSDRHHQPMDRAQVDAQISGMARQTIKNS